MKSLAKGAISGGAQLDGTEIEWLTKRLRGAQEKASEEINRPGFTVRRPSLAALINSHRTN
jgi:hypothetical protein